MLWPTVSRLRFERGTSRTRNGHPLDNDIRSSKRESYMYKFRSSYAVIEEDHEVSPVSLQPHMWKWLTSNILHSVNNCTVMLHLTNTRYCQRQLCDHVVLVTWMSQSGQWSNNEDSDCSGIECGCIYAHTFICVYSGPLYIYCACVCIMYGKDKVKNCMQTEG
jgi:hypothetical protein